MTSLQQNQENITNNKLILSILRSEVEKTLKSATQGKLNRALTSEELNDCSVSGVNQLLKIYTDPQTLEKSTTHSDETDQQNKSELSSLLNILVLSNQQIFERVQQEFQSQLKKQFGKQEIINILTVASNEETQNDSEESDHNENEDEDEEEECIPMTEEEFQQDIAEAFENIRRLGRSDGQRLARLVRDSFCEINGREPELREMADVFTRIKSKLADEAKDDGELLSSSHNIIIKDDVTNADDVKQEQSSNVSVDNNQTPNKNANKAAFINIDVNNATKEEKEELLKFAKKIVKEDLETQAKNQLVKLIGREPTKQELSDMLVQLATTSLLDCSFDSSDDASDYNPDAQEEKQQLLNDIAETEAFDNENSQEVEEPNLINKPILTTPVKKKGASSRVDYYFEKYDDDCPQQLINKAVTSFKKLHDRMPNNEEMENIKHFLHVEKAELLNEQIGQSNENKENTSFKLNFGSEDVDAN